MDERLSWLEQNLGRSETDSGGNSFAASSFLASDDKSDPWATTRKQSRPMTTKERVSNEGKGHSVCGCCGKCLEGKYLTLYMYKDRTFCSDSCRYNKMRRDEEDERASKARDVVKRTRRADEASWAVSRPAPAARQSSSAAFNLVDFVGNGNLIPPSRGTTWRPPPVL